MSPMKTDPTETGISPRPSTLSASLSVTCCLSPPACPLPAPIYFSLVLLPPSSFTRACSMRPELGPHVPQGELCGV